MRKKLQSLLLVLSLGVGCFSGFSGLWQGNDGTWTKEHSVSYAESRDKYNTDAYRGTDRSQELKWYTDYHR